MLIVVVSEEGTKMATHLLYDAAEFEAVAARIAAGATVDEALEGVSVVGTIEIEEPVEGVIGETVCPHCGGPVVDPKAAHGCCSMECWWDEVELDPWERMRS